MVRIKLIKSLMVSGSRLLAPGTILEHSRGQALIEKGVAVAAPDPEPEPAEDDLLEGEVPEGTQEPGETLEEGTSEETQGGEAEGALQPGEIEAALAEGAGKPAEELDGAGETEGAQVPEGTQEPATDAPKPKGKSKGKKGAAAEPAAE